MQRSKSFLVSTALILLVLGNFGGYELVGEAKDLAAQDITSARKDIEKLPKVEVDEKKIFKGERKDFQVAEDPEFEVALDADSAPVQISSPEEIEMGEDNVDVSTISLPEGDLGKGTNDKSKGNSTLEPSSRVESSADGAFGTDDQAGQENQAGSDISQKEETENSLHQNGTKSFQGILELLNENTKGNSLEVENESPVSLFDDKTKNYFSAFEDAKLEFAKLSSLFQNKNSFASVGEVKPLQKHQLGNSVSKWLGWLGANRAGAATEKIMKAEVLDSGGNMNKDIQTLIEEGADPVKIKALKPERAFKPGKYSLRVEMLSADGTQILTATQDFTWGVLAINVNKSIYSPGETAKLAFGVLDENGEMVCDAKLELRVENRELEIDDVLSTENGKIKVNEETCHSKEFTLTPDFEAEYKVGEWGTYEMTLTAETANGTHTIKDSFEVSNAIPFDVERVSATRIFPKNKYPVIFNITANQDFKGEIVEDIPENFEIEKLDAENSIGIENLKFKILDQFQISSDKNVKKLVWDVNIKKDENISLGYQYDAPDVSPQFYLLGPLQFKSQISNPNVQENPNDKGSPLRADQPLAENIQNEEIIFQEARQWQAAVDAPIAQYSGGLLVYADDTVGTPKYKTFDDTNGFGSEQSASSVGSNAIEWIRVAACPTRDEWIIATRDSGDVLKAQVCTGVDGGVSCGTPTTITSTAGTHGLRNFDVAYENSSGDALLVYGTATADELRKIEWNGSSWTNDAAITTTRTSGTVEWVELTSRKGSSDQIGIAYSDSNDDVSAYRWSGSAVGNEATQAITTNGPTADLRKFDVSFEGTSGDMYVAAGSATTGQYYEGALTAAGTWSFATRTATDWSDFFIDIQEPGANDYLVISSHPDSAAASEGWAWTGSAVDDDNDGDDPIPGWAASYQLSAASFFNTSSYFGVGVISSSASGADDIEWWTYSSGADLVDQTVNTRSRGAARFIDLFDYPNAEKVLLITADANSDLWADTWAGATGASAWTDLTSGGALETSLASATTDVVDFAFRLAPPTVTISGSSDMRTGSTVRVAVNGTLDTTHTGTISATDGSWSISGISSISSGNSVIVFVEDSDANESTAITTYDGTGDISGLVLNQNVLSIGNSDNRSITLADVDDYQNSNNENVMHSVVSSTLTVDDDGVYSAEKIDILSGNTLTIGAAETLTTYDLTITGTLTSGGNSTYNVAHNWVNNGSFTQSTSTVNMNGSTAQAINGSTATTFNNLNISNSSAAVSANTNFTTNGTLTVGAGAILTPAAAVVMNGSGTLTGSGTVQVTRTAATPDFSSQYTISGKTLTNLTVDYASASAQTISAVNYGNLSNSGNGNRTLASSGTIGISGTFSPGSGTYTVTGSTVDYNGAAQTVAAINYNNLTLSGSGAKTLQTGMTSLTGNFTLSGTASTTLVGNLAVAGQVTVNTGATLNLGSSGYTLTLSGSGTGTGRPLYMNGGTLNEGTNSTVKFTGTGATDIQNETYNNLELSPSGGATPTYTLMSGTIATQNLTIGNGTNGVSVTAATNNPILDINGDFTLNDSASFTGGTQNITVGTDGTTNGDFVIEDTATWTAGSGILILDGGSIGAPTIFQDKHSPGSLQDMGNIQIGASPAVTDLASDLKANSLTVSAGDRLNTNGYDLDVGNGGVEVNGTLDCTDDVETDETFINTAEDFNVNSGATLVQDQSTVIFDDTAGTDTLITDGSFSLYNLQLSASAGVVIQVQDALDVDNNVTINGGTLDTVSGENNQITVGGSWDNNATFMARNGLVLFDAGSTGKTIEAGSSSFYDVQFDNGSGGWTIQTNNMTVTHNLNITNVFSWALEAGRTLEVDGTYTIADAETSATTWNTGSIFYLNGTSQTIGSKTQNAEVYGTLQIGADTDIRMWNSSASSYSVNSSGSLYSMDHANVDGDLYIWGDYHTQTNDYWSYATDFDGTAVTRQVDVRIDPAAKVTVDSGDTLASIGTSANRTTVSRQGSSSGYEISCLSGGTINFQYTNFDYLDGPLGLDIQAGSTVTSLDYTDFDNLIDNSASDAFITVASSVIGSGTKTITGVNFDNTGNYANFNVNRTGADDSGYWDFDASTGTFDGEAYDGDDGANEADPGMLRWDDSTTITLSLTCEASSVYMPDYTLGDSSNYNEKYFADTEECIVTDNTSASWTLTLYSTNLTGTQNTLSNANIKLRVNNNPAAVPTTVSPTTNITEPDGDYSLDSTRTIITGSTSASGDYNVRITNRLENLNTLYAETGDQATMTFTLQ